MKSIKVTVYTRDHGTRKYRRAKPNVRYSSGAIYVLRYAGRWETLPEGTTWPQASVAALAKQVTFLEGAEVPAPAPQPRKRKNAPLEEALDPYLETVEKLKSHKTFLAYKLTLQSFVRSCGCKDFEGITRGTLENFAIRMKEVGLSDRTISNRLVNVVTFLRAHGVRDVSLSHKYTEKQVRAYTTEELKALFAACDEEERLLFSFFLQTGFREQEVQYASYKDINFQNHTITVKEKLEFGFKPKDSEEREVPVPDALLKQLRERWNKRKDDKVIFPGDGGHPNGHLLRDLKSIAERAGLRGEYGLHKFRKTFATLHHANGVDARTIQDWLGHSDLATTLKYLAVSDLKSPRTRKQVNGTFSSL
jgi:integrase